MNTVSKKQIFSFVVIALIFGCTPKPLSAEEYPTGSLLWKISGNRLSKPSYILGTQHLMPWDFFYDISGAEDAFNSCDALIVELGDESSDIDYEAMPEGIEYSQLYDVENYEFFMSQINEEYIESGLRKKPYAIALSIIVQDYQLIIGNSEIYLDDYIKKLAKKKKNNIYFFETENEQLDFLYNCYTIEEQAEILLSLLKARHESSYLDNLTKDVLDYIGGDLSYDFQDRELYKDKFDDCFVIERNNNWMQSIPELIKEKSCFIAVGSAHLGGEFGILHQLKEAGFVVEAVK